MIDGKYNKNLEKEIQKYWEEKKLFIYKKNEKKEVFSLDTPPPTISGSLHIGHIFSYTQAEIMARYKKLKGFNVFYPFGFDNNGLATEILVERETKKRAKDYSRSEFRKICLEISNRYAEEFKGIWQSLGFSVDWNLKYQTMDDLSQKVSQKAFIKLAKQGQVYQAEKPVLWCVNCQTSIAQAELESLEKTTMFNYIPFFVEGEEILVATTRPEYLGGCRALLLNPNDPKAKRLEGKEAIVPLYEDKVPVILDEEVDLEKGTGAVMCCTYGDGDDVIWARKHNLSYIKVIEDYGVISENIRFINGLKISVAREKIIELLKEKGLLRKQEEINHVVSIHERCGCEVEQLPSLQWYIEILNNKEKFLEMADKINWHPYSMKKRYVNWVLNLKWDWCISRQRFFGVPFPVWYCKNCNKPHFAEEKDLPVNPLEKEFKGTCECGCKEFYPEKDVIDTWGTSSLTPLINARWGEEIERSELFPMSLRPQAHDIIRTWTFYTIVRAYYHKEDIPWKDIMISGFVLAKKGEKISKSKNNANFGPKYLIEQYGADSIRYWTANNKLGTDTSFLEEDIKSSNRFLTKLWNASKFILMHLEDYHPTNKKESIIKKDDLWLINKLEEVKANFVKSMDEYEMGNARKEVDSFFWNNLCDNYLELVKERLYQPEKHGTENTNSAKETLYYVLLEVLKLYFAFVPHICEKIYLEYYKEKRELTSLVEEIIETKPYNNDLIAFGEMIENILSSVRRYKTNKGLSLKAELKELKITSPNHLEELKDSSNDLIASLSVEKLTMEKGGEFSIIIDEEGLLNE